MMPVTLSRGPSRRKKWNWLVSATDLMPRMKRTRPVKISARLTTSISAPGMARTMFSRLLLAGEADGIIGLSVYRGDITSIEKHTREIGTGFTGAKNGV